MIKRGEIYYADLSPVVGSEQGGTRPVLIIQNDVGNKHSGTTIVAALTTQIKHRLPVHVYIPAKNTGLKRDSLALCEQVRTISVERLKERVGYVPESIMQEVGKALIISFGIT
jgi:mRNA interferase MazF